MVVNTNSGATVSVANLIPNNGVQVDCVAYYVTTAITGATSFSIGDGTTADLWGHNVGVALGTADTSWHLGTAIGPRLCPATLPIVLTANGGNFSGGAVRLVVFYHRAAAPTS